MEIAKIRVNKIYAETVSCEEIPAGIKGAKVTFEYIDSAWEGLDKTVVFKGACTKDVLNCGTEVEIPAEVVSVPGCRLRIGVFGVGADKAIAVPTLWADLGVVMAAADPSGDTSTDPALPIWAQLDRMIGNLNLLNTETKENLVAAINEALRARGDASVDDTTIYNMIVEYLTKHPPADGQHGGYYTPSVTQPKPDTMEFSFIPSQEGMPEVQSRKITLPASDSSGTGSSDSGRKLVAAIHYSNQQELTPTAIDPETGHITVAETVQADYWGWYCDDYFKFKVWEPSFDTANIPAKFLEGNGQPYAIERIDDHTVGLMKGHGAWGDPYDVPASLDLSLFTLIGTKNEEMPPVEGLNLQDFDLEVWGNHIRPYIYLYDDAGATIPVSKKDMIDVYYEKNFYNHLTLHRRGGVITGTISMVDATGTTNIRDLTFTIPPDAVVSKMQFARRYSPASEMNIRIYEVNGGAAGE